jgi:hypothetical protein
MRFPTPAFSTGSDRWHFRPTRSSMVRLGVVLAGMVFVNANAREAHATCGDYVMLGGPPAGHPSHSTMLADGVPAPVEHRPCRGPGCRQAPPFSPLVPSPVEPTFRHDLVAMLVTVEASPAPIYSRIDFESARALEGHNLGILRPPR